MQQIHDKPFFSVATPCFNSEKTIERTLRSVLEQDFVDYEYIIVDGGSTDGTIEILRKYEPLFEGRMTWKSEPDNGLYDAFNKGVNSSKGLYCWNVNSDDFLEPKALSKVFAFIKGANLNGQEVITGAMNFLDLEGNLIEVRHCQQESLESAFKNDSIGVNHPATIVPKEIYDKYGVFDPFYRIIGDTDWAHRLYLSKVKFVVMDDVITNMTDGGVSNLFDYKKSLRDRLYYLKKYYSNPLERFYRWARWTLFFYLLKFKHNRKK